MHHKNVLFYIENHIEYKKLKLKDTFHMLEVTFQKKIYLLDFSYTYFQPNNKNDSLHV